MPAAPAQATDVGDFSSSDSGNPIVLYALRQRYAEHQTAGYVYKEAAKFWKFK